MSLVVLVLALLGGVAQAETAVRCEAVWIGPSKRCAMRGDWAASGAGPNEEMAKQSAVERLVRAVRYAADLDLLRRPLALIDPARCATEARAGARITCFPEASLWEKRQCYVDLPVKGCPVMPMIELNGVQWRVIEKGRDKMCKSLTKQLKKVGPRTRLECMSRCFQDVRVRCPKL